MSVLIALGIVMTVVSFIVAVSLWGERDLRRSWAYKDVWRQGVYILIFFLSGAIASFAFAVMIGK